MVIGLTGLVIVLALLKIMFRNVPLWAFEYWAYFIGVGATAWAYLTHGAIWALVAAGLGLATGLTWSSVLEHARRRGPERSRLERAHHALVKWAQK